MTFTDRLRAIAAEVRRANEQLKTPAPDTTYEPKDGVWPDDWPVTDRYVVDGMHGGRWTMRNGVPIEEETLDVTQPEPVSDKRLFLLDKRMKLIETQLNQIQDTRQEINDRLAKTDTVIGVQLWEQLEERVTNLGTQLAYMEERLDRIASVFTDRDPWEDDD